MLVFLHGLGQTPESWTETITQLKSAGPRLCPNLAELLQGKAPDYQSLYQAVSALCSQAGGTLDLCGLSLGGVLALQYAIEQPRRVRSLVLIAPQYRMPKNLLRVQNLLFRFMPKTAFQSTGFEKESFIRLCGSMMDLDFTSALSAIECPVLVLCGERDSANKKAAVKLTELLPNAEMQEIPGAGHEVNRDAPEKLAGVLSRFSQRMEQGG